MKCLIFGAGGYIGRHLVHELTTLGHEIVENRASAASPQRPDLADPSSLQEVDWAVDCVFALAGVTGTSSSFTDYAHFIRGNEMTLLNILEAIRHSLHRPRVVFPSSRLVYMGSDVPLSETALKEARTIYAANKISCELYLRAYSNAFDIPHTVFRVCVPYGNTRSDQYSFGTMGNFISQAMSTRRIRLYGDGESRRSFTYIDDLCRAIIQGSVDPRCQNETFNLPGENLSLRQAADLIAVSLGATVESAEWPLLDLQIESGSTVFDSSKLASLLDFKDMMRVADWAGMLSPRAEDSAGTSR